MHLKIALFGLLLAVDCSRASPIESKAAAMEGSSMVGLPTVPPVMKNSSIHGQRVTDNCFEAYRSTFVKTTAVTDAVQTLVNATRTVQVLRIPGLAAWKASTDAQEIFTKINQKLDQPLTENDHADVIHAHNEEIGVSVFIGLVINNMSLLKPDQQKALTEFQSTAQAERVARMLVDQACPELSQAREALRELQQ